MFMEAMYVLIMSRRHLISGPKQGFPLHNPYRCKLGLHPGGSLASRLKLRILASPEFNINKRCMN